MTNTRQPDPSSRILWVTVGLSLLVHALLALSVGYSARRAEVVAAAASEPRPPRIDFELIDTPESAEVEEAPDSSFLSNRNTRAQDLAEDAPAANRRPRVSQDGEIHDLRAQAAAPNPGIPEPGVSASSQPSPPQPPVPEVSPSPEPENAAQEARERPQREDAVTVAGVEEEMREEEREETQVSQEPRRPSPPSPRATGREATALAPAPTPREGKISLSEAEQDLISKALEEGEFSYEATQSLFADYFLNIKHQVETKWNLLLFGRYSNLDPSRTTIDVLVLPDGTLGEMVVSRREGDDLLPVVSSVAIKNSAPFGPSPYDPRMPTEAQSLPLRIRFHFTLR